MKKQSMRFITGLIIIICMLLPQGSFAETGETGAMDPDLGYFKSVMEMIKEKYKGEVTEEQLIEGALKGMFSVMDPYTTYYTMEEADEFFGAMSGTYDGIGVVIEKKGDYMVVLKAFQDSPAQKAGIMAGDKILKAGGKSLVGASTDEASSVIKGPKGTKIVLELLREGVEGTIQIEVERDKITLEPVEYKIEGDIGYIKLEAFNANAAEFMTKALDAMDSASIKKIILDLRENPGGYVSQAVDIANHFVPKGLITKLDYKSESQEDEEYYSKLESVKYKLAVLVNGNSASASEILSGAIQDTGAGTLIGTKTFGKAKVQNMFQLLTPEASMKYGKLLGVKVADTYELAVKYGISPSADEVIGWTKITTGLYTTPKGRMIDMQGITPDITIENSYVLNGIDIRQIQKLQKVTKPKLNEESIDVYNAEKVLKAINYDIDTPDNKLDKKTFEAIKKFQKAKGGGAYGRLDFTTQQWLNDELEKLVVLSDKQYQKALEILNK